ncbi:hypothetical protein [Plantactinospora sp. KLBMP9567]|uniref:hypothetical protein n=1 Tax=Plantactinospora sp. KLBMP9567 TaxID=3085900 RepID=UPI002981BFC6|nr:hypothetical protein [Plantactinospora sp. KLBMP9567]MDW5327463.1 hypothetical protein [Plantactinospora sp. KLBMP9567]
MAALAVYLVILLPAAATSAAVALLPLRPARLRLGVMTAHLLVTLALIAWLPGTPQLWLVVFSAGLAIAIVRLVMAAAELYRGGGKPPA